VRLGSPHVAPLVFFTYQKKKKIDYIEPNLKTTTNGLNQQNGVGEHERIFGYTTGGLEKGKMPLWCDWEKIMVNYIPCKKY
jgi:hypothetical protein